LPWRLILPGRTDLQVLQPKLVSRENGCLLHVHTRVAQPLVLGHKGLHVVETVVKHKATASASVSGACLVSILDISLTLNVYSHVLPDMGDAAADAMDAALG
jgi:hypothetical protein